MRATNPLFKKKGFLGRSLDEFKRLSMFAIRMEGIKAPEKPYVLHSFHEPDSIEECKVFSDEELGGFSSAKLDWIPPVTTSNPTPAENKNGHAKFHGNISIELPVNRPEVHRTGYAAWRTWEKGWTIFGKQLWDIDSYHFLALRIKSDGRKYFVNLQTESIVPTDIHQHRLYARRPGEWETVLIKWNEFVRTNHGMVVEPQSELLRQKVRTVGIGLIDRIPGPYELCIERIWATNRIKPQYREDEEDKGEEKGELKSKSGEKIRWGDEKTKENYLK